MKTKGSFEYLDDSAARIFRLVSHTPRTNNAITLLARKKYYSKIHPKTVKRLLEQLQQKGLIKGFTVGRTLVWQKERAK